MASYIYDAYTETYNNSVGIKFDIHREYDHQSNKEAQKKMEISQ